MPNPLYNTLMGGTASQQSPVFPTNRINTPAGKLQTLIQAINNPVVFVRNAFPDIPENIINDPNQILQYLKQTRGIPDQEVQKLINQIPR